MVLALENKKLIFVGGKRWSWETTSASTIALHLSARMKQRGQTGNELLFSQIQPHSIGDSFNIKIGDTPTPITSTLDCVEMMLISSMTNLKRK